MPRHGPNYIIRWTSRVVLQTGQQFTLDEDDWGQLETYFTSLLDIYHGFGKEKAVMFGGKGAKVCVNCDANFLRAECYGEELH